MKKFLFLLIILIVSCSKVTDKRLIGKWKVVNMDISSNILKQYPANHIKEIEEKILNGLWIFNEDFSYKTIYSDSTIVLGEWSLGADGKTLLIKNNNQTIYTEIKILSLDNNNLVTEEEGGTKIFYKKLN